MSEPTMENVYKRYPAGLPLQSWFALFLVFGSAAIFFAERVVGSVAFSVVAPLGAMVLYIAIGRTYLRHGISRTQYADSIYYLGFLFTLASITAAISDYGSGDEMKIISRFGVKLITTLVGLGVRVYLVSFTPSAADLAENVEESLSKAAGQLRDRLDRIVLDLDSLNSSLALTLKTANERVSSDLSQSLDQAGSGFRESLESMRSQTADSLTQLGLAGSRATGDLADSIRQAAHELRDASSSAVRESSAAFAVSLQAASAAAERSLTEFSTALGAGTADISLQLRGKGDEVLKSIEALLSRIHSTLPEDLLGSRVRPALDGLAASIEGYRTRVEAATSGSAEAIRAMQSSSALLVQSVDSLAESVKRASATASETPPLEALRLSAERAEASLASLATASAESERILRQANEKSAAAATLLDHHIARVNEQAEKIGAAQLALQGTLAKLQDMARAARDHRDVGLVRRILGALSDETRRR